MMQKMIMVKRHPKTGHNDADWPSYREALEKEGVRINQIEFFSLHYEAEKNPIPQKSAMDVIPAVFSWLKKQIRDFVTNNSRWIGSDQVIVIGTLEDEKRGPKGNFAEQI